MKKIIISIVFLSLSLSYHKNQFSKIHNDITDSYQCEITIKYRYLSYLNNEFGNVLISGNLRNIFIASKTYVEEMNNIKLEFETIDYPDEMKEPHNLINKSIESYRKSAAYIRIAMGILLKEYSNTDIAPLELLSESEMIASRARKDLSFSITLHEEFFKTHNQYVKNCE